MAETPPLLSCPECGANNTLVSQGWDGEVNRVMCHPARGGCRARVEVDHSGGRTSEEVETLRNEVAELRASLEGANSAESEG